MTARDLRTSEENHATKISQLNGALRCPGMFGGEEWLRHLFDELAYLEREEERGFSASTIDAWSDLGMISYISRSVARALEPHLPGARVADVAASVFADAAWHNGWLTLEHHLAPGDRAHLCATYVEWAARDHSLDDLVRDYGKPGIRIGNPRMDSCVGYTTSATTDPIIWFYLRDQAALGESSNRQAPVLAARGPGRLPEALTYTPAGTGYREAREVSLLRRRAR